MRHPWKTGADFAGDIKRQIRRVRAANGGRNPIMTSIEVRIVRDPDTGERVPVTVTVRSEASIKPREYHRLGGVR